MFIAIFLIELRFESISGSIHLGLQDRFRFAVPFEPSRGTAFKKKKNRGTAISRKICRFCQIELPDLTAECDVEKLLYFPFGKFRTGKRLFFL